jgi:hypothetical protein
MPSSRIAFSKENEEPITGEVRGLSWVTAGFPGYGVP